MRGSDVSMRVILERVIHGIVGDDDVRENCDN
jgi:hypothetical protein